MQRVDRTRLDLLARTYRELGVPRAQAAHRARMVYATNLGLHRIHVDVPGISAGKVTVVSVASVL